VTYIVAGSRKSARVSKYGSAHRIDGRSRSLRAASQEDDGGERGDETGCMHGGLSLRNVKSEPEIVPSSLPT